MQNTSKAVNSASTTANLSAGQVSTLLKSIDYQGGKIKFLVEIDGEFKPSSCAGTVGIAMDDILNEILESKKFNTIELNELFTNIALRCKKRKLGGKEALPDNKELKAKKQEISDALKGKENSLSKSAYWQARFTGKMAKTLPRIEKKLLKLKNAIIEIF